MKKGLVIDGKGGLNQGKKGKKPQREGSRLGKARRPPRGKKSFSRGKNTLEKGKRTHRKLPIGKEGKRTMQSPFDENKAEGGGERSEGSERGKGGHNYNVKKGKDKRRRSGRAEGTRQT